jgi:DNA-binding PadR family transcriptional regulator
MNRSHHASQPLTAIEFEILLSLAGGDLHGYAILQEIELRTDGQLAPLPGTLYRAVNRLLRGGWVAERPDASASKDDARRRIYHLTSEGRRLAAREAERLARQLLTANARNVLRRSESR